TGSDEIARVAREVDAVLADPAIDHIAVPKRALALIGPGIWGVTAREGALKLRESAHVLAEGFDSETLLHGAAVPLGSEDVLVGLQPQADQDGLTGLLLAAAGAEGITTYELDARSAAGSPAQTFLAQITLTVRLQLLAARFSQARGTNPDKVITGAWARDELWSTGALRE
ncbi:MAG TPA: hypothetical protein VME01_11650, partial [Solirubrobacteraceae bacterium]|nr:hypothetical protein [Solirubrobacteraceae bacterium]